MGWGVGPGVGGVGWGGAGVGAAVVRPSSKRATSLRRAGFAAGLQAGHKSCHLQRDGLWVKAGPGGPLVPACRTTHARKLLAVQPRPVKLLAVYAISLPCVRRNAAGRTLLTRCMALGGMACVPAAKHVYPMLTAAPLPALPSLAHPSIRWGDAERDALYKGLEVYGVGRWREIGTELLGGGWDDTQVGTRGVGGMATASSLIVSVGWRHGLVGQWERSKVAGCLVGAPGAGGGW